MMLTHTLKTDDNATELEPVYKLLDTMALERSKTLKSREQNPGVLTRSRYCNCQLAPLNLKVLLRNVKPATPEYYGFTLFAALGRPVVELGPAMSFNEAVKLLGNASNVHRALKFLNGSPVGSFSVENGFIYVGKVSKEYNKRQLVNLFCTCEGAPKRKLSARLFTTTPRKQFNDVLVAEMIKARKEGYLIGRATYKGILTLSYAKSLKNAGYYSTVK